MSQLKITLSDGTTDTTWLLGEPVEVTPVVPPSSPPPQITNLYAGTLVQDPGAVMVSFNITGGEGQVNVMVDYGDGTREAGFPVAAHTYQQGGTHTITVTAKDSLGRFDKQSKLIHIDILDPQTEAMIDSWFVNRQQDVQTVMAKLHLTVDRFRKLILASVRAGMNPHDALDMLLK